MKRLFLLVFAGILMLKSNTAQAQQLNTEDEAALNLIKTSLPITDIATGLQNLNLSSTALAVAFAPETPWVLTNYEDWYGITVNATNPTNIKVLTIDLSQLETKLNAVGYTIRTTAFIPAMPEGIFNNNRLSALGILNLSNCKYKTGPDNPWYTGTTANLGLEVLDVSNNNYDNGVVAPSTPFLRNIAGGFPLINQFRARGFRNALIPSDVSNWLIDANNTPINAYVIDLADNNFSGTLPSVSLSFGDLFPITLEADISNNRLEDFHLLTNTTLSKLRTEFNNFTDAFTLQNILEKAQALSYLYARSAMHDIAVLDRDSMVLASSFSFTPSWQYLDLSENRLNKGINLDVFATTLVALSVNLSKNELDSISASGTLNNIYELLLHENQINQRLPIWLFGYQGLQTLNIGNNNFWGKFPTPPTGFSAYPFNNLRNLKVNDNQLWGTIPLHWLFINSSSDTSSAEVLNFSNNHFDHVQKIDTPVSGNALRFPNLSGVYADSNRLDFWDFEQLVAQLDMRQDFSILFNRWFYIPRASTSTDNLDGFVYSPQKTLGGGGVRHREVGKEVFFAVPALQPEGSIASTSTGNCTNISWGRLQSPQTPVVGNTYTAEGLSGTCISNNGFAAALDDTLTGTILCPLLSNAGGFNILGGSTYTLTNLTANLGKNTMVDSFVASVGQVITALKIQNVDVSFGDYNNPWYYAAILKNDAFPDVTLFTTPKRLIVGDCYDNLGLPVQCQHMFVQWNNGLFRDSISSEQRQNIRDTLGVTMVDSCECGDLELWEISDETYETFLLANGKGTRQTASNTGQTQSTQLLSANTNYYVAANMSSAGYIPMSLPAGNKVVTSTSTKLAFIDSGVDYDHPNLTDYILPANSTTGADSCALINDFGYAFVGDSLPYDGNGHGTAVAGVLAGADDDGLTFSNYQDNEIALMPIRYTDEQGSGSLFHAVCGIYRAVANGAQVINASWGYVGEECTALSTALHFADTSDVLVVCAAGNDGMDNNSMNINGADTTYYVHWPSNYNNPQYGIDNIISVAALDSNNLEQLASFSNYSDAIVNIAAQGFVHSTTVDSAGSGLAGISVNGTSFAAPRVSRAAAILRSHFPNAKVCDIKEVLRLSATQLQDINSQNKLAWRGRLNLEAAYQLLDSLAGNVCTTVAVDEIPSLVPELTVFPNPFGNSLHLQWANTQNNVPAQVRIYSIDGRLRQQFTNNSNFETINTGDWQAGFYILQVQRGNAHFSQKIVKY